MNMYKTYINFFFSLFLTGAANQKLPTYAEATTLPTYEEAERSKFQEAHQDSDSNIENPDVCPYFYHENILFYNSIFVFQY